MTDGFYYTFNDCSLAVHYIAELHIQTFPVHEHEHV